MRRRQPSRTCRSRSVLCSGPHPVGMFLQAGTFRPNLSSSCSPPARPQLDDLQAMLEDFILSLTSHLSGSLQDDAGPDRTQSQESNQSAKRSAFTAKTVKVCRELRLLFQRYEHLQESVKMLMGGGGAPPRDRDPDRVDPEGGQVRTTEVVLLQPLLIARAGGDFQRSDGNISVSSQGAAERRAEERPPPPGRLREAAGGDRAPARRQQAETRTHRGKRGLRARVVSSELLRSRLTFNTLDHAVLFNEPFRLKASSVEFTQSFSSSLTLHINNDSLHLCRSSSR